MNLAGAFLLGYLLGSGPAVAQVEEGISSGVREMLGLPEQSEVVTTLHLPSRGNLFAGKVEEAQVDLFNVELTTLRWPAPVGTPSTGNLRGQVQRLKINFHRPAAGGFQLERLTFLVDRLEFNLGRLMVGGGLSLEAASASQAEIVIDPREVAKYIDARSKALKEVELVLLEEGEVRLLARLGIGVLSAALELRGGLQVVEGRRVEVTNPTLRFAGLPVPALVTKKIMQEVNPIFRLEEGSFLASIFLPTSLHFEEGKISIRGEATAFFPPPAAAE